MNPRRRPKLRRKLKPWTPTLLALVLLAGCGGGGAEPAAIEDTDMAADQVILGLRQWLTADGVRRAEMTADTAFVFPDSSVVHVRNVHVLMYDERGEQSGELTAEAGVLDTRTEGMTARGNAVLVTRAGNRRIESEVLQFDPTQNRIWSDVATTVTEEGTRLTGTSFTATFTPGGEFSQFELRGAQGRAPGVRLRF